MESGTAGLRTGLASIAGLGVVLVLSGSAVAAPEVVATTGLGPHAPAAAGQEADQPGSIEARVRVHPEEANPEINERAGFAITDGSYYIFTRNSEERPHHYDVRIVETGFGGMRLNAPGTEGEAGSPVGYTTSVYTQSAPGQPGDIYLVQNWEDDRTKLGPKVNTRQREFYPTMTRRWLLFTRYTARTDDYDVLLFDRSAKTVHSLATVSATAAVYAGQVHGDWATWYTWTPRQSNVFRYRISTGRLVHIPKPPGIARQYGSSVDNDGTVYFERRAGRACGQSAEMVRYPRGGPPEVIHSFRQGQDGGRIVLEPGDVSGVNFTLIRCRRAPTQRTDAYWLSLPD